MKSWWADRERLGDYADRFALRRSFNPSGDSYGFFDVASFNGRRIPVLGVVQEMKFDSLKSCSPDSMRDQMRAFILRYFMRISSFQRPEAYATERVCLPTAPERIGFGYSQHFYKFFGAEEAAAFSPEMAYEIVDLRDLFWKYEWILVKVDLYSFYLRFRPFGPNGLNLEAPLSESTYLVLTRDFIVDESSKQDGVIGRYGFGYALVKNPTPQLLAYGPGEFDLGFKTFEFTVLENGDTYVRMAFAINRPNRILNLPIDPVFTFIDAANLLTGGVAARRLCISRRELETTFLVQHYGQHYDMIVGALSTWSQLSDWLDERNLPDWVIKGTIA
jgi:hypothetical protein